MKNLSIYVKQILMLVHFFLFLAVVGNGAVAGAPNGAHQSESRPVVAFPPTKDALLVRIPLQVQERARTLVERLRRISERSPRERVLDEIASLGLNGLIIFSESTDFDDGIDGDLKNSAKRITRRDVLNRIIYRNIGDFVSRFRTNYPSRRVRLWLGPIAEGLLEQARVLENSGGILPDRGHRRGNASHVIANLTLERFSEADEEYNAGVIQMLQNFIGSRNEMQRREVLMSLILNNAMPFELVQSLLIQTSDPTRLLRRAVFHDAEERFREGAGTRE